MGDEKFVLHIKAYDKDEQSDTMTLTIIVNDINDNKWVKFWAFDWFKFQGTLCRFKFVHLDIYRLYIDDRSIISHFRFKYQSPNTCLVPIIWLFPVIIFKNLCSKNKTP